MGRQVLVWLINLFFGLVSIAQDTSMKFSNYTFTIPGSNLKSSMVAIQAGSFVMGSPENEKGREGDEGPQRRVTIAPFWMGAFEVTRDEFDAFYKDETTSENQAVDAVTRPSPQYVDLSWGMGKEGGYPVNSLSQYAALMYCRWLYHKTGIFYRLPTEAEWEFACRAGSGSRYFFGDDDTQLDQYAWLRNNSGDKFQKVGLKKPNPWGLYDMLGNVCEWTLDHYEANHLEKMPNPTENPMVPANKSKYPKALRGGAFTDEAQQLRCANRFQSNPAWNQRDPQIPKSKWWLTDARYVGFRIVRPLQQPGPEEADKFYTQYLGK